MNGVLDISLNEALAFASEDTALFIDVRKKEEILESGVINAKNIEKIELYQGENMKFNANFEQELCKIIQKYTNINKVIFVCRGGKRSRQACDFMQSFKNIECYNLTGGIQECLNCGVRLLKI